MLIKLDSTFVPPSFIMRQSFAPLPSVNIRRYEIRGDETAVIDVKHEGSRAIDLRTEESQTTEEK